MALMGLRGRNATIQRLRLIVGTPVRDTGKRMKETREENTQYAVDKLFSRVIEKFH